MDHRRTKQHYLGCLLGGAVGDALGAPIEFMDLTAIRRELGVDGLTDYAPAFGRLGAITDDTQMTLFTAEALIRWHARLMKGGDGSAGEEARLAYLRWFKTQGGAPSGISRERGGLLRHRGLHSQRAPGNTCLSALGGGARGTVEKPINDSKGCGGIMRMAPVGLVAPGMLDPFEVGAAFAALTHGHPSGYLSAGFFAQLIYELAEGQALGPATETCIRRLRRYRGHEETLAAVTGAIRLASTGRGDADELEQLGGGWVGEEALAIALYCTFCSESFEHGVLMAVNHGGDSDSTGAITGNILGMVNGLDAIPQRWIDRSSRTGTWSRKVIVFSPIAAGSLRIRASQSLTSSSSRWSGVPTFTAAVSAWGCSSSVRSPGRTEAGLNWWRAPEGQHVSP